MIWDFMLKYYEGCEIVYGVCCSRKIDIFFKCMIVLGFYCFMNKFGIKLIYNYVDFCLMNKRLFEEFVCYLEVNLFLRGIVFMIGFRLVEVLYDCKECFVGKMKYLLKKMLLFVFNGIILFSVVLI